MLKPILSYLTVFLCLFIVNVQAQTITGVWRGKVNRQQTELKLVKNGDQLVGVAYYYSGKNQYKKYSVKGHFDPETNGVIWWDEVLLEEQKSRLPLSLKANPDAQLMVADFNCPGADEMLLDGNSTSRDDKSKKHGTLHLEKTSDTMFPDEWDEIIENYFVGANDPELIDSIYRYSLAANFPDEESADLPPAAVRQDRPAGPSGNAVVAAPLPAKTATAATAPVVTPPAATAPATVAAAAPKTPNLTKFSTRKNVLQTVIPITAKTIELRFYDNAQVDGDSIALFLNGKLLLEHILLTEQPYTVKLDASELGADNELVMVAENLGSIPPNTSFMVAIVGDKRYEARLFANENSSALIRIIREQEK
ncbi:hypothetical protein [Flavihumibacter petaseus]|uniref:DUF4369 domain-containing protein n=1 Tax=Flavihumibacter petaseus NBRC 106054 TaxID=1220578 RepID=A0A0E9N513_9BACT|nr:hypothetical protein [Flavihumibacter petaseus]GAO45057.1 hypothetical protein FPE01S_04_03000 [Flavihumibacter petaseus NBRC 106054]